MATRIPEGQYMTVSEFARKNKMTVQNVYNAIHKGRIPYLYVGGTYLIPIDAVLVDRRITSGKFIGFRDYVKDRDIEKLAKRRGLIKEDDYYIYGGK